MKAIRIGISFGLAASLIGGCGRETEREAAAPRPEPPAPASAKTLGSASAQNASSPPRTGNSAADAIAQSRCQRAMRCNDIGENKKYASTQECIAGVRSDWKDDLSARECPSGVDETQLSECLATVRAQACDKPLDALAPISECTTNEICKRS